MSFREFMMHKAVKLSLAGAGALVSLFIIALVVLSTVIDLNDYKDRISTIVFDNTGRTLVFDGELDLLVFPRFGVELGGLSLSNAEGFGPEPMIKVSSASVTVQTLPLIFGKVEFGDLKLDDLTIDLGRTKDGVTNWDDIVGRVRKESSKPESKQDDSSPFSLEIEGMHIVNANFNWDDQMSGTAFLFQGMNISTGKIAQGSLFPVDVKLRFDCSNPKAKGTLALTGKSFIDFENREYNHMDTKMNVVVEGDVVPGEKAVVDMALKFLAMDFNKEQAQMSGLEVSAYGATVHVEATLSGITNGVKYLASMVTVDSFDARKTMAALGQNVPETADVSALTKVEGMVDFVFEPGNLEVKTLKANVDGARIVGNAKVMKGAELPFVYARLDVGSLDLDRYLPPEHAQNRQASKQQAAKGKKDDTLLPAEFLRQLLLDIEAKVAELKVGKARFTNVIAKIDAKDGVLDLHPLSMDAYGGKINMQSSINSNQKASLTKLSLGVEKVDVGGMAKDVKPGSNLAGILDFDTTLSAQGNRVQSMLSSLNGKFKLFLADGVFPGVNLFQLTKRTHASKGKKGKVEASKSDSTKFGSIQGTGVITKGILKNKDLEIKAPGLRATGNGAVALHTKQIDYMVKAKMVPQADGQGGDDSDDLFGVMVPIHVTGDLQNPYIWVSLTEYVKALGGVVIDVTGSVFDGVTGAVKGVGNALDSNCCEDESGGKKKSGRSKFLGIF